MTEYSPKLLQSIYGLGLLYYELGYLAAAERIFNGLAVVDKGSTKARIGLGLIRVERGRAEDGINHLRQMLRSPEFSLEAKLGLAAAFVVARDFGRAVSLLKECEKENRATADPEYLAIWEALYLRAQAG